MQEIKRLRKLKNLLKKNEKLPYLILDLINIRYLTGFEGSNGYLLISEGGIFFISDARYEEYSRSILPRGVDFLLQEGDVTDLIKTTLKGLGTKELFLEEHSVTLSQFLLMKKKFRGIKLLPGGDEVNSVRMVKDEEEIALLQEAALITDRCVDHCRSFIRPGITEWDVAVEIEHFYRTNGCTKTSFDSIVASGTGSSMPHYQTSMTKKLEPGDPILIDMGCTFKGYNSDLTRTMFLQDVPPAIEKIYHIVHEAQERAVKAVKPGMTTGKLDAVARDHISAKGFGKHFGHSLGHGFGLEVHEMPALRSGGEMKLKKHMTITIEPGIYVPGLGGVRIEDMVLVTPKGGETMTKSTKEIVVIG